MADDAVLLGGPQDGARVHRAGDGNTIPPTIYVGPKWLGDGFAAWSAELCWRFPCEYHGYGGTRAFVKHHQTRACL